jgi:hypothetical protein
MLMKNWPDACFAEIGREMKKMEVKYLSVKQTFVR